MAIAPVTVVGLVLRATGVGAHALIFLTAFVATGCESRGRTSLDHNLGDLSKVDRVVVSRAGVTPIATIADATKVKAVIAFVERYRTDWRSAWAGAGSERVVTFYAGPEGVKSFGVGPRGINDGTYVRELSDAELRELATLLGIEWPLAK